MTATREGLRPAVGGLRWTVDPKRSEVELLGRHMGAPWVNALVRGLSGELMLDCADPVGGTFALSAQAGAVYVGDPYLNTQLRTADVIGDAERIELSGRIVAGLRHGGHAAEVAHALAWLPSPLAMVVEISQWESVPCGEPPRGWQPTARVSICARQLDPGAPAARAGGELCLRLEAVRRAPSV